MATEGMYCFASLMRHNESRNIRQKALHYESFKDCRSSSQWIRKKHQNVNYDDFFVAAAKEKESTRTKVLNTNKIPKNMHR